jgi:XTP/dITP diphosphohydrolase
MSIKIDKLVLATRNKHKLEELKSYLAPHHIEVIALDTSVPDVKETGKSFEDNALLKAKAACKAMNLPALADDSGLCVWGIGGSPGVYSARWAGPEQDYEHAFNKIESELKQNESHTDRRASFICTLALCFPDQRTPMIFEGRIDGTIVTPPRGPIKFGYDPIFIPNGYKKTFAEMTAAEKQKISHRTQALRHFIAAVHG